MGWTIAIKETKTETKYKIWSTIVDAYITNKWMTKKEIISFLFWHKFRDFADNFIEDSTTFPIGYTDKESGSRIFNADVSKANYKFKCDVSSDDNLFYNKFFEELNNIGVEISIKDDKYLVTNLSKRNKK